MPNLNHFTANIKKSKIYSKIDISKAFHFIPIRDEDKMKTCVAAPWGIFKFNRLGRLRNAPGSFQAFIQVVLQDIPDCYVYIDDILVFSNDHASHLATVTKIFERLKQYGLALNLPKCVFAAPEVNFLGYKINSQGAHPLGIYKLQAISECQKPSTQKQLLKYLGMLNFYRKTLPSLEMPDKTKKNPAEILQPLYTAATTKLQKTKFDQYWKDHNLVESFKHSKMLLQKCVTLTYPNPNNPLALSCDASDKAVGAVLEELQERVWRPLGFYSKHLTPSKQKWSILRRELLSIQAGIRHFLPDIYGRELTVFTDHKSILATFTAPNLQVNDPIASRQLLEIAQYTYDIRYKPGKDNLTADEMSRPLHVPQGDAYRPEIDTIAAIKQLFTNEITPTIIKQHQATSQQIQNFSSGKHSPKNSFKFVTFNGVSILAEVSGPSPCPVIPESLRSTVLKICHNFDHCGQAESKHRLSTYYSRAWYYGPTCATFGPSCGQTNGSIKNY